MIGETRWPGVLRRSAHCAEAVQWAYEWSRSSTRPPGDLVLLEDDLDGYDTQVLFDRERNIVAFPGTASLADWGVNRKLLQASLRVAPGIDVPLPGRWHRGYAAASKRVASHVAGEIDAMRRRVPGVPVAISGHSLGGGLAGVTAAILSDAGVLGCRDMLITFGAPRYASRAGASWLASIFDSRAYRWVFESEVVPYAIPPIFYRHVGRPIFVGSDGGVRVRQGIKGVWREIKAAARTPGLDLYNDHGMARVAQWLKGRVEG